MTLIFCLLLQDVGDRVEVTFTSGKTLRGTLRENSKLIKLELEDIQGSVSFDKSAVKSITLATGPVKPIVKGPDGPNPGIKTTEPAPAGRPAPEPPKVDTEAAAIYAEFPQSQGWGPAKYEELKKFLIPTGRPYPKYLDARIPSSPGSGLKSFAAANEREARFFENYDLWLAGKRVSENK